MPNYKLPEASKDDATFTISLPHLPLPGTTFYFSGKCNITPNEHYIIEGDTARANPDNYVIDEEYNKKLWVRIKRFFAVSQ